MLELFIYYRLDVADAPAARAAVTAFQAGLQARYPWLKTRLLRRPNATDGQETWMETYASDPALNSSGITPDVALQIELSAAVLEPWLRGARHSEFFVACAS